MKYLLDSVILIDHLNGQPQATAFLAAHQHESALSAVTWSEVLHPFEGEAEEEVVQGLEKMAFLPIEKDVARSAASLSRRFGWRLPDAYQAALADHHRLRLVTRNTRDFKPEKHSFVLVPYKI